MTTMTTTTGNKVYRSTRNEVPWAGQASDIDPSWDMATIASECGLDWNILSTPSLYHDMQGNLCQFDNRQTLFRSDNGMALSQVSANKYKAVQPMAILEVFKELIENTDYKLTKAGTFQDGRKLFVEANLPDMGKDILGKGDVIEQRIRIMDSCDGTIATTVSALSYALVCLNGMVVGKEQQLSRTKHSQNWTPVDAMQAIGQVEESFAAYLEKAEEMAKIRISDGVAIRYFAQLYAPKSMKSIDWLNADSYVKPDMEAMTTNQVNQIANMLGTYHDQPGSNLASRDGTAWGLLNAVTYHHDHAARSRDGNCWQSGQIGQGATIKGKAYDMMDALFT